MNINNIRLLIRRYLIKDGKKAIGALVGIWILIILLNVLTQFRGPIDLDFYHTTMIMLFIFGAAILASLMFNESSQISKGYQYSILPVSVADKLASSWFISSLLFLASVLGLYFLGLGIFQALSNIGMSFKPISFEFLKSEQIQVFFVMNAFCLMGAAWFRKSPLIKNIVLSTLVSLLFFGALLIIIYLLEPFGFSTTSNNEGTRWVINNGGAMVTLNKGLMSLAATASVSLFFLVVAYFKLKERRV